ncbi:MAG: ABC transporter permease [Proteobacteria bacterium]|nr:ABC transporter permease [Pseudomonadota bacterium]
MSPAHFLAILKVETRKLFRHPSGRVGLVLAIVLGLAGPLAILWFGSSSAELNGQPLSEKLTYDAPASILWSLTIRNVSHVIRLLVLAMGALALAGELKARTLREALLRPVPRWSIPLSKWLALCVWIAVANALTWTVSALGGAILFDAGGEWQNAAVAMALTTAGDFTMAALILLLAAVTRSVAASIVLAIVLSLMNWFSRAVLYVVEQIAIQAGQASLADMTALSRPWLPTYAMDGWTAYVFPMIGFGENWWQPWITAAIVSLVCIALTSARLQRLDIQ